MSKPRAVIAGANGLLGEALARYWADRFEVVGLVRKASGKKPFREVIWDGKSVGSWQDELEGAAVLVNLAGSPVSEKWTPQVKKRILDSRVEPTAALSEACSACTTPPKVWMNGSAVGFYGDQGTQTNPLDESKPAGHDYLAEVCVAWEKAAKPAPGQRLVYLRTGIVISTKGGALPPLRDLAKAGLGGQIAGGKMIMPWIDVDDWVGILNHLLMVDREGPVNLVAPNPVTNGDFMEALRHQLKRPWSPPVPLPFFKIGAALKNIEPTVALISQNVVPQAALESGYQFRYPTLAESLAHQLAK